MLTICIHPADRHLWRALLKWMSGSALLQHQTSTQNLFFFPAWEKYYLCDCFIQISLLFFFLGRFFWSCTILFHPTLYQFHFCSYCLEQTWFISFVLSVGQMVGVFFSSLQDQCDKSKTRYIFLNSYFLKEYNNF